MARREPVRVAVIFEPGQRPRPVWFDRRRQKHMIRETTYCWRDRSGDRPELHFTVTDGTALYELIYDIHEGTWMLNDQQAAP